jgi:uncharacterized protein (UPF0548 family)
VNTKKPFKAVNKNIVLIATLFVVAVLAAVSYFTIFKGQPIDLFPIGTGSSADNTLMWTNGGPTAGYYNPVTKTTSICNAGYCWERDQANGTWKNNKGPVKLSNYANSAWKVAPKNGVYPWTNGGPTAGWVQKIGGNTVNVICNGKWCWYYDNSLNNGKGGWMYPDGQGRGQAIDAPATWTSTDLPANQRINFGDAPSSVMSAFKNEGLTSAWTNTSKNRWQTTLCYKAYCWDFYSDTGWASTQAYPVSSAWNSLFSDSNLYTSGNQTIYPWTNGGPTSGWGFGSGVTVCNGDYCWDFRDGKFSKTGRLRDTAVFKETKSYAFVTNTTCKPTLHSPANNATIDKQTVTLRWSKCDESNPNKYQLRLTGKDGSSRVVSVSNTEYTFTPDSDFSWDVRQCYSNNNCSPSSQWSGSRNINYNYSTGGGDTGGTNYPEEATLDGRLPTAEKAQIWTNGGPSAGYYNSIAKQANICNGKYCWQFDYDAVQGGEWLRNGGPVDVSANGVWNVSSYQGANTLPWTGGKGPTAGWVERRNGDVINAVCNGRYCWYYNITKSTWLDNGRPTQIPQAWSELKLPNGASVDMPRVRTEGLTAAWTDTSNNSNWVSTFCYEKYCWSFNQRDGNSSTSGRTWANGGTAIDISKEDNPNTNGVEGWRTLLAGKQYEKSGKHIYPWTDGGPTAGWSYGNGTTICNRDYCWNVRNGVFSKVGARLRDTSPYTNTVNYETYQAQTCKPTLNSPANNATINDQSVNFTWSRCGDVAPSKYQVRVTGGASKTVQASTNSLNYTPTGAQAVSGTKQWDVRQCYDSSCTSVGAWSNKQSFNYNYGGTGGTNYPEEADLPTRTTPYDMAKPWTRSGPSSGWYNITAKQTNVCNGQYCWQKDQSVGGAWLRNGAPVKLSESEHWDVNPAGGSNVMPWEGSGPTAGWVEMRIIDGQLKYLNGICNGPWCWYYNTTDKKWHSKDAVDVPTAWRNSVSFPSGASLNMQSFLARGLTSGWTNTSNPEKLVITRCLQNYCWTYTQTLVKDSQGKPVRIDGAWANGGTASDLSLETGGGWRTLLSGKHYTLDGKHVYPWTDGGPTAGWSFGSGLTICNQEYCWDYRNNTFTKTGTLSNNNGWSNLQSYNDSVYANCRPSLNSPRDNANVGSRDVSLSWSGCSGVDIDSYKVTITQLSAPSGNDTTVFSDNTSYTYTPSSAGSYSWSVTACYNSGCTNSSLASAQRTFEYTYNTGGGGTGGGETYTEANLEDRQIPYGAALPWTKAGPGAGWHDSLHNISTVCNGPYCWQYDYDLQGANGWVRNGAPINIEDYKDSHWNVQPAGNWYPWTNGGPTAGWLERRIIGGTEQILNTICNGNQCWVYNVSDGAWLDGGAPSKSIQLWFDRGYISLPNGASVTQSEVIQNGLTAAWTNTSNNNNWVSTFCYQKYCWTFNQRNGDPNNTNRTWNSNGVAQDISNQTSGWFTLMGNTYYTVNGNERVYPWTDGGPTSAWGYGNGVTICNRDYCWNYQNGNFTNIGRLSTQPLWKDNVISYNDANSGGGGNGGGGSEPYIYMACEQNQCVEKEGTGSEVNECLITTHCIATPVELVAPVFEPTQTYLLPDTPITISNVSTVDADVYYCLQPDACDPNIVFDQNSLISMPYNQGHGFVVTANVQYQGQKSETVDKVYKLKGDYDENGTYTISGDLIPMIMDVFADSPTNLQLGDMDSDGLLTLEDVITLIKLMF